MAALTETSRRDYVLGNVRAVSGELGLISDGDTWAPGLRLIERVEFAPASLGSASVQYRVGVTGNDRVIFEVGSGTIAGTCTVYGT